MSVGTVFDGGEKRAKQVVFERVEHSKRLIETMKQSIDSVRD